MKYEEFYKILSESIERRGAIMGVHGEDYGKDKKRSVEDMLSTFKEVAKILNVLRVDFYMVHTAIGVAEMLIVLKMVRNTNMKLKGESISNPTRVDSNDDMHNYMDLAFALELDAEESARLEKVDEEPPLDSP